MTDLYRKMKEHSRVIEEVIVTDEGVYKKDCVPDSYGGAQLRVIICNMITFSDGRGQILQLEMANEEPLNKDKSSTKGAIMLDGVQKVAGTTGGTARVWTTRKATIIDENRLKIADKVMEYMKTDGDSGVVL